MIHHTVSDPYKVAGDVGHWTSDTGRIATSCIIDITGTINKCFEFNYWAHHLGIKEDFLKFKGFKDYEVARLDRDIAWMRAGQAQDNKQAKADFFKFFSEHDRRRGRVCVRRRDAAGVPDAGPGLRDHRRVDQDEAREALTCTPQRRGGGRGNAGIGFVAFLPGR